MFKKVVFLVAAFLLLIVPASGVMTLEEKLDFLRQVEAAKYARDHQQPVSYEQKLLLRQAGDVRPQRELDEVGGPDQFGYFYKDSNEDDGPTYEWVDIRPGFGGNGTALELMDDSYSGFINMPIGWSFTFYGETYTQFNVSSNGWISFISEWGDLSGNIPENWDPNATLAAYWRDLDPGDSAEEDVWYYFDTVNQRIIVQWYTGNFNGPMNNAKSFEVIIDVVENTALFQYNTSDDGWDTDGSATIGVENQDGVIGLTYDWANIEDQLAIFWYLGEGDANVSGTVFDADTHMPVAGATVRFGFFSATTNSVGYFSLEGLFSADYTMQVFAPRYSVYMEDVEVVPGDNTYAIEIEQASLIGHYYDFELNDGDLSEDGDRWQWGIPTSGPGEAHSGDNVWATGLNGGYQDFDNATLTLPTYTLSGNDIRMSFWTWWDYEWGLDGFNIQVSTDNGENWTVVEPDDGYNEMSISGLDNEPGFSRWSEGWRFINVDLNAFVGQSVQIRFRHGTDGSVNWYYGAAIDDISIYGSREVGSLTGAITYAESSQPVNEATVILYLSGSQELLMEATTVSDGIYRFPYLEVDDYRLAITAPGYEIAVFDPLTVGEGAPTVVDVALNESSATTVFSGTVISADLPETPVVGATVSVPGLELSMLTDETGSFDFGVQPEGIYAINISHDPVGSAGYHNIRYRGVVVNEGSTPLELVMYNILAPGNLSVSGGNANVTLYWELPVNMQPTTHLQQEGERLRNNLERIYQFGTNSAREKAFRLERELRLIETELNRRIEAAEETGLDELQDFLGFQIEVDGEILPIHVQGTYYNLVGLQNGHLYSFRVAADYGYDESTFAWSNEVQVRPLPMDEIPWTILEDYTWIEINPANDGGGTGLNLTDDAPSEFISMGDLTYNHYGNFFDQFSVSPNGWISFSDMGWDTWPSLPSPWEPNNTVVVYGRDLDPGQSEEEDVFYLIDEENERVIVQWYTGIFSGPNNLVKSFQLVLDCANNQIYYNYESSEGGWEEGIAVGMEDSQGVIASVMPSNLLTDEMTVRWTPVTNYGNIAGTVIESDTGEPMEGVRVRVQGAERYESFTDAEGHYVLFLVNRDLAPLNLVFEATGYEQGVVEGVEWEGEEFDVEVNTTLTHVSADSPPEIAGYYGSFDNGVQLYLREPGSFEGLDMIGPDDGTVADAYAQPATSTSGMWAVPLATRQGRLLQLEVRLAAEGDSWLPRGVDSRTPVQVLLFADQDGQPGELLYRSAPQTQGRIVINPDVAISGPVWVAATGGAICVDQSAEHAGGFAWRSDDSTPWTKLSASGDPIVRAVVRSLKTAPVVVEDVASMLASLPELRSVRGATYPVSAKQTAAHHGSVPIGFAPRAFIVVPVPAGLDELDEITFLGYDVYGSSDGGTEFTHQNMELIEDNTFFATFGSQFEDQEMFVYAVAHVEDSEQGEVISNPSETVSVYFNMPPAMPEGISGSAVEEGGVFQSVITWDAVTVNADMTPCVDLAGYSIFRNGELVETVEAGVTTYTDDPPFYGFHTYTVGAFDEVPNQSGASMAVTIYVGPTGFFTDLENGSGDFTTDERWQYGEPSNPPGAYSGSNVLATNLTGWYEGDDYNIMVWDQTWAVEGPSQLVYSHFLEYEWGWDGYRVDISIDEGETWSLLTPDGGYTDEWVDGIDNGPGFTGYTWGWQDVVFQLGQYSGELVMFRFVHGADPIISDYFGAAIDDIYLLGGAGFPDFGSISGTITACSDTGTPIPGVRIRLGDSDRVRGLTGADGSFMVDSILVGTWEVHFWHDNFWSIDQSNVVVELAQDTDLGNLVMYNPAGSVNRTTLELYVPIGVGMDSTASGSIELTSDGCGLLRWGAWLELNAPVLANRNGSQDNEQVQHPSVGPVATYGEDPAAWGVPSASSDGLDELWDNLFNFDASSSSEANDIVAAATTPTGIYAIDLDAGELLHFTREGVFVDASVIPNQVMGSDGNPPLDLAIDPVIGGFYGGNSDGDIFYFSEQMTGVILMGNVGIPIKGLAYDFIDNMLYTYGVNDFRRYDPTSGDTEILIPNGSLGTVTGLAYMASDPDGYTIWILRQTATGMKPARYNPTTGFYDLAGSALYPSGDGVAGGMEISSAYSTTFYDVTTTLRREAPTGDLIDIWSGLSTVPPWIRIDGLNGGDLQPGESTTINLVADLRGTRLDVEPGMEMDVVLYFNGPFWGNPPAVYIPVTLVLAVDDQGDVLPTQYALHQNYPNPFNPSTAIKFDLIAAQNVKLTVFNMLGQEVARLADGPMQAGFHKVSFDASRLASGVYFYRLETPAFTKMKKMVLVK